jgi:acyl carrier protein
MQDTITSRVIALLADETGVKPEKISLTSALNENLGMEGDDAVEFFQRFQKEFALDLRLLWDDWDYYFLLEGLPVRTSIFLTLPVVLAAVLLDKFLPHIPFGLSLVFGFIFWFTALLAWERYFRKPSEPQITVQDLIDCAKTGVWSKKIPESLKVKLASRVPSRDLGGIGKLS